MSPHISAKKEEVAPIVFISGDPMRIKFMAETFLTDAFCFNEVRGMLGYTGYYNGKRVSMMGTGIGIPTTKLYVQELIQFYDVKSIIRVGTTGALRADLQMGDIILANGACTDSSSNRITFNGLDYAPTADFELLHNAYNKGLELKLPIRVGSIFSTDTFYADDKRWEPWVEHGVLGVEMETSIIYTLAAKHNVKALSLLTVSDNIVTQAYSTPKEREQKFTAMFRLALELE